MSFEPLEVAREQISPLLRMLVEMVEAEGKPDQVAFFGRIAEGIDVARDGTDLAEPFMELSMSAFVGFDYSPATSAVLDSVLMAAGQLSEVLSLDEDEVH